MSFSTSFSTIQKNRYYYKSLINDVCMSWWRTRYWMYLLHDDVMHWWIVSSPLGVCSIERWIATWSHHVYIESMEIIVLCVRSRLMTAADTDVTDMLVSRCQCVEFSIDSTTLQLPTKQASQWCELTVMSLHLPSLWYRTTSDNCITFAMFLNYTWKSGVLVTGLTLKTAPRLPREQSIGGSISGHTRRC